MKLESLNFKVMDSNAMKLVGGGTCSTGSGESNGTQYSNDYTTNDGVNHIPGFGGDFTVAEDRGIKKVNGVYIDGGACS